MNLTKEQNETNREYIWRVGQAKDNGELELTWEELAPTMAVQCDCDSGESVFRKRYAEGKGWLNEVFIKIQPNEHLQQLRDEQRELAKERVRLRDERTAYNRVLRDEARHDEANEALLRAVAESGRTRYAPVEVVPVPPGDCDLLACVNDWHIGAAWRSANGSFNYDIANARVQAYLREILAIQARHGAENVYVAIGGDMVSGNIHTTIQVSNRENVIQQVILCAELLSDFLYELSKYFKNVFVASVAGNHTRITPNKENAILGERLDILIAYFTAAKLGHIENIMFSENGDNVGTIDMLDIRGHEYVVEHGDFDAYSDSGIARLITYLGHVPYAVVTGHIHETGYIEPNGIVAIRSGSLCGSGDNYTTQKRLRGNASQTVCVCDSSGITCMYPVKFAGTACQSQ